MIAGTWPDIDRTGEWGQEYTWTRPQDYFPHGSERSALQIIIDYWYWLEEILASPTRRKEGSQCAGEARCDKEKDYG